MTTTRQTVISTSSITTDPYASLALTSIAYTTAKVTITNGSKTAANSFRIKDSTGKVVSVADIVVPANGTNTYTFTRLTSATSYNFYLERLGFNQVYIAQISDTSSTSQMLSVATLTCVLSMSVASMSASATFSQNAAATPVPIFCVIVATAADFAAKTVANYRIISAPSVTAPPNVVQITGLQPSTSYQAMLSTQDKSSVDGPYADKYWYDTLNSVAFTTAASGSMTISTPLCTSCTVSWTGSTNDTFQVLNINDTTKPVVVVPATQGPKNAEISNLMPGTAYKFLLQIMNGPSSWSDSGTATTTTASSILSLNNATDSSFVGNWTSAYANATYIVEYSAGSATPVSSSATQLLTYDFTKLSANTSYTVKLFIVENNKPTEVSRSVTGTAPTEAQNSASAMTAATKSNKEAVKPSSEPIKPAARINLGAAIGIPLALVVVIGLMAYFVSKNKKTASAVAPA